jgi:hypothetical protein
VGFEVMPQVADPEIAATWDEIELEAALRDRSAEAQSASSAQMASSLFEALRAVEELQQLPKAERKRRAEELLRTLTSTPPSPAPEQEAAPDLFEHIPAPEPPAAEPVAESPEISEPLTRESPAAEPAALASPEISERVTPESSGAEPPAGALPDIAESLLQNSLSTETAEALPEIAELPSKEPPAAFLEAVEPVVAEPVQESPEPCASAAIAGVAEVDDPAANTLINAQVVEPMSELALEPLPLPAAAAEPYSIPKFLATECPSLESEHPDRLIPFRTAAAGCAVIGAVLLIYFASSRELSLAAYPILGASVSAATRAAPPEIPPSVAVRQAFVAEPLAYSAASEPLRSYRAPFVGFDFLDVAAPPPAAAKAEPPPEPPAPQAAPPAAGQAEAPTDRVPEPQIVPPAPAEETAALPAPAPDADLAALLRRGDALIKAGDIVAARSAYERAAAGGSAKGEIGVGKTYDPLVLAKLGARGVRGDPVEAASWYARAGEAGDEEGQQRLHALISGLSNCLFAQGACSTRRP